MPVNFPPVGLAWGLGNSSFQKLERWFQQAARFSVHGPKWILRAPWTLSFIDSLKEVTEWKQRLLEGEILMALCSKPPSRQTEAQREAVSRKPSNESLVAGSKPGSPESRYKHQDVDNKRIRRRDGGS